MSETADRAQLIVIGAGPGGYPAAFLAADLGMDVTLIDPEINPGGVCLYRGCIPTKTLLHVAKVIRDAEEAKNFGVTYDHPKIDLDQIRHFKDSVIQKLTGGTGQLAKQRKINYIQGKATFQDNQTLKINCADGSEQKLYFEKAIIATGTIPMVLPGMHIESLNVMNSATAMELESVPDSLLVVGGGYIGLELGTVYATLGSRVSVVEMMPNIVPGGDDDLVRVLSMRTRQLFESVMLNTRVVDMKEEAGKIQVTFKKDDTTEEKVFEKVLITIGRKPNTTDLGIENTKVEMDERGFIKINSEKRTSESNIYAIGDVVGGALLAHKATYEGKMAVHAIIGKNKLREPKSIPAVLYTDPEIAWTGLTEKQARDQGVQISIAKFPWAANGRCLSFGRNDGVTKIISDPNNNQILGVGIAGPGAGDLISEAALAIELGAKVADIAHTVHPHPTTSETIMETAEAHLGLCTHIYRPKK